jgi:GAF domain-containing protein
VAPVAPAAAELGVRSSLSVHLLTDTALGSLNLYSLQPRDYDPAEVETAKIIAAQASAVLAYTRNEHRFWQAIDTRNLIGHAQGMLTQNTGSLRCVRDTVCRRFVSCWGTFAGHP